MVAPKEFGRFNARDVAISYIPVAGPAYGAGQAFASGNYATGIVGVAAAVYQAYGLYSAYSSGADTLSQGTNGAGGQQQTAATSAQPAQASGSALGSVGRFGLDVLGRLWNLPNTIVGGGWALLNRVFGGEFSWAEGVLHLENAPLQPEGTAITLGDVVVYGGNRLDLLGPSQPGVTFAGHELRHVFQGRALGPLYIPANAVGWTASFTHFALRGFSAYGWPSPIHGPLNFIERGPLSTPPRSAPWRSA